MSGPDASERLAALEFFGFGPAEKPDLILLRSRKFNKQRSASSAEQKALIEHHFQVLAAALSQPSSSPVPHEDAQAGDSPPDETEAQPAQDREALRQSDQAPRQELAHLLPLIEGPIHRLHNDSVINNTFGLMMGLRQALNAACQLLQAGDASWMTTAQRDRLVKTLLSLYSSLIVGALHKGELSITNAIIRHKNTILRRLGVEIPPGHDPIDPQEYQYSW